MPQSFEAAAPPRFASTTFSMLDGFPSSPIALALVSLALSGCAGAQENAVRQDLDAHREARRAPVEMESATASDPGSSAEEAPTAASGSGAGVEDAAPEGSTGSLDYYLARAFEQNPRLEAEFDRWQAEVLQISRSRRLPNPVFTFGYFISSVETRVGPQQARLGLQQAFPWPTKLSAGADAASAKARASQRRFDAAALRVAERVEAAYWRLWSIRRTREIHREHLDVLRALSETILARVATGRTSFADQQQVDLTAARLEDQILGMGEDEFAAAAALRAAVGLAADAAVPTPDEPPLVGVPTETEPELRSAVARHPLIESFDHQTAAHESAAVAAKAERLPSFTVGADWIITGEADSPGVTDSGKDAVIVGAGIQVPLWQGNYDDEISAARAEADVARHEKRAALDQAEAALAAALSEVRDEARRVDLYRNTLLPQADSAYESVLGAYTTGQGTVAQSLMAQRDLLDLRVELESARARHAAAWAQLEWVVGRDVRPTPQSADTTQ